MAYELPPILEKRLDFDWFPTPAQCLIYRNWGTVPAQKIAKVLGCDLTTVFSLAEDMGLDRNVTVSDEWLTRGYITLIRNNWHLLDYDQLCILLGWSREYLAFILKEDDFLDIKLGKYKPKTPELKIEPLTEDQIARTKEIRGITLRLRNKLPAPTVQPFDFFQGLSVNKDMDRRKDDPIFQYRIIYSYCALYGDTFSSKELIDISFPDRMLRQYQSVGINGVWTQSVLSTIAPYPFDPAASDGYEKRLEGMRYLTEKLEKYGIKLYLYINEPRTLPDHLFGNFEELKGTRYDRNETCLCLGTEPVREYLKNSVAFVVKNVPKLGGFYTITASENRTNCYSHVKVGKCNCPRCKDKTREDLFALVNQLIWEGAHSVNPDIKVWAYTWAWNKQGMIVREVADRMPQEIGLLAVSEDHVHKMVQGVDTFVKDYSISIEGPGEKALETWQIAKEQGRDALAKVQVNNTWELSTVPFLPVFDKVYRHLRRIAETGNVNGLFLSWTLGGYPSPVLEMVREFSKTENGIPELRDIYHKIFPQTDTEVLAKAFTAFSDAFDEYPFSMNVVYFGPQQMGVANPFFAQKTNFDASMVCYPYDDLKRWRDVFSEKAFLDAFDAICTKWQKGLEYLSDIDCKGESKLQFVLECAQACYWHFCSVRNHIQYLMEGTTQETKLRILQDEEHIAVEMLKLTGVNAALGYEASNHYFYTRQSLFEKIVNCQYLRKQLSR